MTKDFQSVKPGEHLYILQPMTFNIWPAEVKNSILHPSSIQKSVWVIDYYIPFKNKRINTDALKMAEAEGVKTTMQSMVEPKASFAILMSKPMPTIIATTKEEIERWLTTCTPSDLSDYLSLRQKKGLL